MKIEDFRDITYVKGDDRIVTLTFNRPERKNAFSKLTFHEIFWAVDHFEKDEDAGVMIMTGARDPDSDNPEKEAYSSGGYFHPDAFKGISKEILDQIDPQDIAKKMLTVKLFKCEKPIIGAINGLAIGGSFTMTLAGCDLIYMSEHAWVQMPFSSLGIISELASSFLLPRLMGFQKAKEIIYFSEKLSAVQCRELGIANDVLPHNELMAHARRQALKLTPPGGAGYAIRQMKRALHKPFITAVEQALDLENEGLNNCWPMMDFEEAKNARRERRAPIFTCC